MPKAKKTKAKEPTIKVIKIEKPVKPKVVEPKATIKPEKRVLVYGSLARYKKVIREEAKEVNGKHYIEVLLENGTTELCLLSQYNRKTFKI